MALWGCYNYTMTSPKTATCDACLDYVDPASLEEICGDMVCATCITDTENHFNRDDIDGFEDLDLIEYQDFNTNWDDHFNNDRESGQWDDDPNPYHGTYSEC